MITWRLRRYARQARPGRVTDSLHTDTIISPGANTNRNHPQPDRRHQHPTANTLFYMALGPPATRPEGYIHTVILPQGTAIS
jgi:hypothetical protein